MLDYEIVAPAAGGDVTAACIVLHGLGDSREGWREPARMILPPHVATVLVDGPEAFYEGFSWFPISGMTDPSHGEDDRLQGIRRSRGLLRGLIDGVLDELDLAPEQLLLMGFSQGGCMVLDAALRDGRRFAGTICISGFVGDLEGFPDALAATACEQRILWTHGTYDQVIRLGWAETCRQALACFGVAVDFRTYDKEHSVDPADELPQIRSWIEERIAASAASAASTEG